MGGTFRGKGPQAPVPPQAPASIPPTVPPAPERPVRHHVHHSYMWLGSARSAIVLMFALLMSVGPSFAGALFDPGTRAELAGNGALAIGVVVLVVSAVVVVIIALIALYQWASYKHLYFELGSEEFSLYQGILNKKRVHVPYQRVQSVDQTASLLQRVFGVCSVSIDTAGGAANKALVVPYLQKSQAEWLRSELFARKRLVLAGVRPPVNGSAAAMVAAMSVGGASAQSAPAGGSIFAGGSASAGNFAPVRNPAPAGNVLDAPAQAWDAVRGVFAGVDLAEEPVSYECGLSNKELLFTGLSNGHAFAVAVFGAVCAVIQLAGALASVPLLDGVSLGLGFAGGGMLVLSGALSLVFFLILWAVAVASTCISFGGFRARRRGSRIEVERGLFQHQVQGVDVDRVQSVVIRQSLVKRILGYCEVSLGKVDATTEEDSASSGSTAPAAGQGVVIHPFVRVASVPQLLAGIIPEYADMPTNTVPVAPVALRRAIVRRGILYSGGFWLVIATIVGRIACGAAAAALPSSVAEPLSAVANVGAVMLIVAAAAWVAVNVVDAVMWARGSGFACNRRFMQVGNAGLSRETVGFPRKKIQFGCVRENPLQRRAGVATLQARTAAGVSGTTVQLIDVRAADAARWLDWVEPGGSAAWEGPCARVVPS